MKSLSTLVKSCFYGLFFLTPLIFSSFNSELFELPKMYFVYLATLLIATLHLLNWLNQKVTLFQKTPLDIWLYLFLISQTISTLISVDPHLSIYGYYSRLNGGLLSLICFSFLYKIIVVYLDKDFISKLTKIILVSGFLVSLYGILEHFGIDKHLWVQDVQNRVFSTLGQPNWLAAYLCILIPLALNKVFSSKNKIDLTYYLLLVTCYYICLLFTKSKSGIIAAIISIGIFFFLHFIKNFRSNLRITSYVLPITLFATLSFTISNPIKDQLLPQKTEITNLRSDILITPSEDIRKIVWRGALELWAKYPIFGTGTETFAYSYYWTRPPEHNLTSEWDFLYNKAHNEYINFLATTGIVGLSAYCLLIIFTLYFLFKTSSFHLLSAYLSLLISNVAGFSVVTTSLFFFLIPALSLSIQTKPQFSFSHHHSRKYIFQLLIVTLFFFFAQKIIFYYLADIAFAQAESNNNSSNQQLALDYINSAISLRPNEPLYYSKRSIIAANLALVAHSQKDDQKTQEFINLASQSTNLATDISPASTNFWKERAQIYYYLSSINSKYFEESVSSLVKVNLLAPTDPKAYYLLGQFLNSVDLKKEAITSYQKAVDLKPNYDHALFDLAKLYFDDKNYLEAKKTFELTLKYAPANSEAQDFLKKIEN